MKLIKNIVVLLLMISTLFSVVSCEEKEPHNGNTNGGNGNTEEFSSYEITVENPLGKPLSGVTVYLHLDAGADYNICATPVTTDSNGKVSFNLDTSKEYSVGLSGYPDAYTAKSGLNRSERYPINSKNTTITLDVAENPKSPKKYSVGDFMVDFTIANVNGVEYNLYDMLADKRAVVLNFWFCGCGPCKSEFPALNSAYNTYKNSIEVLAVNDYPAANESAANVKEYGVTNSLDMPLFKTEYGSAVSLSHFNTTGYPTTVIIDRYGVISYIDDGAITSVAKWEEIFNYFISDDYNGTPYN